MAVSGLGWRGPGRGSVGLQTPCSSLEEDASGTQSGYLVSLGNLGAEPARMQEALPGEERAAPAC